MRILSNDLPQSVMAALMNSEIFKINSAFELYQEMLNHKMTFEQFFNFYADLFQWDSPTKVYISERFDSDYKAAGINARAENPRGSNSIYNFFFDFEEAMQSSIEDLSEENYEFVSQLMTNKLKLA